MRIWMLWVGTTVAVNGAFAMPPAASDPPVELTDPWAAMGFPLEEAIVWASDDSRFVIAYRAANLGRVFRAYEERFLAAGWARVWVDFDPPTATAEFRSGGTRRVVNCVRFSRRAVEKDSDPRRLVCGADLPAGAED